MSHVVVIASRGRASILAETVSALWKQTRPPALLILSVTSENDVLPASTSFGNTSVLIGEAGLPRQRNAGLAATPPDSELVTFLDDDVVLDSTYMAASQAFFAAHPDAVLLTGEVLLDGAVAGEVTREFAERALRGTSRPTSPGTKWGTTAYGCNMTVRADIGREVGFDEKLPSYAWLEDRDFSVRCQSRGRIASYSDCRLVHLGAASGRISGKRFGFAQVVNPFYLWRKGTLSLGELFFYESRAFGPNLFSWFHADQRVDRSGRLLGNVVGVRNILQEGGNPEAMERIV